VQLLCSKIVPPVNNVKYAKENGEGYASVNVQVRELFDAAAKSCNTLVDFIVVLDAAASSGETLCLKSTSFISL